MSAFLSAMDKAQAKEMKQAANRKKQRMSSKEAWKQLILLIRLMILHGLFCCSQLLELILAFAVPLLSSNCLHILQLFAGILFWSVVVSADMRKEWKTVVHWNESSIRKYRYNRNLRVTVCHFH